MRSQSSWDSYTALLKTLSSATSWHPESQKPQVRSDESSAVHGSATGQCAFFDPRTLLKLSLPSPRFFFGKETSFHGIWIMYNAARRPSKFLSLLAFLVWEKSCELSRKASDYKGLITLLNPEPRRGSLVWKQMFTGHLALGRLHHSCEAKGRLLACIPE